MNLEEAYQKLESIFVRTQEVVAPHRSLIPRSQIGPTECTDRLNVGQGTYYLTLGRDLPARGGRERDLLEAIEHHWRAEGYTVDTHRLADPQPELLAQVGDFTFRALAVPGSGAIHLGGDTPCVAK